MNNIYDILDKMKLLEGKGSKPDFLDLDKDGDRRETMKSAAKEVDEASYSAKAARAGKDIGKPGKTFAKIAKSAGERYGSKERGEKVAGAVLAKLRAKEDVAQEGNRFTGNLAKARAAGQKMADLDGDGDMEPVREYEFDDRDDFDSRARPGDTVKTTKGTLKKTDRGVQHTRRHDDDDTGSDDDYDEHGNLKPGRKAPGAEKRGRGRPKGTKRAIGAKGPTGKSKLLSKGSIKEGDLEEDYDRDEYDEEGEMAKSQARTIEDAAQELQDILDDQENLPEWVQKKINMAKDYIDTARDYMKANRPEDEMMAEKAVSKAQRAAAGIAYAAKKGDLPKSELRGASKEMAKMDTGELKKFAKTKEKGLPEKKKEESVEETTVAGSVATAPSGDKSKGIFGKGVYEGLDFQLKQKLNESMNINVSADSTGQKSITVSASEEDAEKLSDLLKMAGLFHSGGYERACSACGQSPCGCQEAVEEDYSNSTDDVKMQDTDFMTKTISGGLNKNKVTGQTTIPVVASQTNRVGVTEAAKLEQSLWDLYKKYEPK